MRTLAPHHPVARTLDRLQDLLLVFILLGAPLIFYTKANDVFEFNKITAVRFASSLSVLVWAARAWLVRPLPLTRSPLDAPILGWLLVCVVATFNTVNPRLSIHGVYEDFEGITTWVNYAWIFFIFQNHVRSDRQIHLVLGSVILAGAVAGFYGILQNFQIDFVPWDPSTYSVTRMFSTMGNPNFLAAYLVMSLPITLAVFLDLPERIRTHRFMGQVIIGLGALASVGLVKLFEIDYFSFGGGFQKSFTAHVLPLFPLAAALLLYWGRLKLVLLVSMLFQLGAIAFAKSL